MRRRKRQGGYEPSRNEPEALQEEQQAERRRKRAKMLVGPDEHKAILRPESDKVRGAHPEEM